MSLSRRDLMKLGVVGGAALALPLERTVRAGSSTQSRLASSRLPRPFTLPFRVPPVLQPSRVDSTTDYYKVVHEAGHGRRRPGPQDATVGLQRQRARADGQGRAGPPHRHAPGQQPAGDPPAPALHAVDVGAPARVTVAAGVRRVRQRHHEPRSVQGLPLPEHPDGPDALVPRPRRAPHGGERPHGPGRAVPPARTPLEQSLPIPHGEFDVPLIVSDAMFDDGRAAAVRRPTTSPGMFGDVILVNGRAVAGHEGQAAQVPLPAAQRLDLALLPAGRSTPATRSSSSRRTAGLMPAPAARSRSFRHGMAERYEVVIDFAKLPGRPARRAAATRARRTTSTTTTPTRSWPSTSSATTSTRPTTPFPTSSTRTTRS